ncbi:MAG: hypothetical protein GVY28_01895 [Alphaproteobacteria bacterium]|jgi:hypothetical protein|nr:hypothetical protein [Alphaproteobacteria bacterium]
MRLATFLKAAGSGLAGVALSSSLAMAADYRVSLVDAGMRDYYCTTTIAIENISDAPLVGINTFVDLMSADGLINTSRGVMAGPVAPGEAVQMTMDAPNEPCADIESYVLVVGSCQIENGFRNRDDCAAAFETIEPFTGARGR